MTKRAYDVVIIGGGIMGSATAFYLMNSDPTFKVVVVERDPAYEMASTTLSLCNVRIQFSLKENIQISQYTLEVLERFEDEMEVEGDKPNIAYRREGNLFLIDDAGRTQAEKALALQQSLGCRVEWLSPDEIRQRYPLYEPRNIVGGTFGLDDGHIDAHGLLMGYKAKARSLGAEYLKNEVVEIVSKGG